MGFFVHDNHPVEHVLTGAHRLPISIPFPRHGSTTGAKWTVDRYKAPDERHRDASHRPAVGYAVGMSSITERIVAAGRALTRPGRPPEQPLSPWLQAVAGRTPWRPRRRHRHRSRLATDSPGPHEAPVALSRPTFDRSRSKEHEAGRSPQAHRPDRDLLGPDSQSLSPAKSPPSPSQDGGPPDRRFRGRPRRGQLDR